MLSIAGVNAVTNQSETKAAPTPAAPRSTSATVIERRGGACDGSLFGSERR